MSSAEQAQAAIDAERTRYRQVMVKIWGDCEQAIAPAKAAYDQAVMDLTERFNAAQRAATLAYQAESRAAWETYKAATDAANGERDRLAAGASDAHRAELDRLRHGVTVPAGSGE